MGYFAILFCTVYAQKVPTAKMATFLQVKHAQPRLTMNYAQRHGLPYGSMQLPSLCNYHVCWSIKMSNLFLHSGIGNFMHRFCFHASGMRCHLGSNSPRSEKNYAHFDSTARQSWALKWTTDRISLTCVSYFFSKLVENRHRRIVKKSQTGFRFAKK